jgi:hypothetical protein
MDAKPRLERRFSNRDLAGCLQREVKYRDWVYAKRGWTDVRIRERDMMAEAAAVFEDAANRDAPELAL